MNIWARTFWESRILVRTLLFILSFATIYSGKSQPLSWSASPGYRTARLPSKTEHAPGFTRVNSAESGVVFTNFLSQARRLANANLMNGSGVALGDYDGDGLCDMYLCDLSGTNALFKNLGNWRFTNVTDQAGVACPKQTCTGAVFGDINGDGRPDLLVTSMGGPHACFINLGNGRFTNTIATAGFTSRLGATSIALADIDGNGTLDLYVANYGLTSILRSGGALNLSYENGKPVVRGRYAQRIKIINNMMWELGEPNALYLNDGKGNFRAVPFIERFRKADGSAFTEAEIPWDQSLSVMFRDLNGDGAPDIYECNDAFTPDRFWINDRKGFFREVPHRNWRLMGHSAMGLDVADIDRDGRDDIFTVEMLSRMRRYFMTQATSMPPQPVAIGDIDQQFQVRRNTLLLNRGGMDFVEIAYYAGVAGSEWSWSGLFMDVDLDGWEDILVTNGFEQNADDMDTQEKVRAISQQSVEQGRRASLLFPRLDTPNVAFRNKRDLTFEEVSKEWGFDAKEISQGMAFADLDNDGDLDVVINTFNSSAIVYRNEGSAPRLLVRLKGKAPNTSGVGAKITVEGGPVKQSQEMICGGRYVSGDDAVRVFACGSPTNLMSVEVIWRNGSVSRVDGIPANSVIELDEAQSKPAPAKTTPQVKALFVDASENLKHKHQETPFDDFALQPSLPHRLSQMGPGVVWTDFTGDGYEDIIVGTGGGGEIGLLKNNTKGSFEKLPSAKSKADTSGLLVWRGEGAKTELITSVNNYEQQTGHGLEISTLTTAGAVQDTKSLPGNTSGGPLAISEVEGRIYLFHGTRFLPGLYPTPAPSHLYVRANGVWQLDAQNESALATVGNVSSAVWTDLDGDGTTELALSCEWGPIRIFSLKNGKLTEQTAHWKTESFTGLWQSLTAADLDQDGRMDLVAGNWGLNTSYNQSPKHDVELYYGRFDAPDHVDMLEAYVDDQAKKSVPWRDKRVLSKIWPWLNEKFPLHAQFATASVDDIVKGRPGPVHRLQVASLASAIFFNRGDHFECVELPREGQFAPVFGINVADFDGDGIDDLFLAQNFFAVREYDSPAEAGRGLLLKGGTKGSFKPVGVDESGIQVFGEQRGSAIADFDHDGRTDLLVTQNGTDTKLYRNITAEPGIRVSLRGGASNQLAAGAQWRIAGASGLGPIREIHIGSGYWSQESAVQVVRRPPSQAKIQVRWPGGKTTEATIPEGAKEIEVSTTGILAR